MISFPEAKDIKHCTPDTETLNDEFPLPEALTLVRQDLLLLSENDPVEPWTPRPDPEPRNPRSAEPKCVTPLLEPYFINEI